MVLFYMIVAPFSHFGVPFGLIQQFVEILRKDFQNWFDDSQLLMRWVIAMKTITHDCQAKRLNDKPGPKIILWEFF